MEIPAGKITHYFNKIGIAGVEISDSLAVGDKIHIKGHTTDFEQTVESMQIEHEKLEKAAKGQSIGLKVNDYVREHDIIYKIES